MKKIKYRVDYMYEGDGQSGQGHYYSFHFPKSVRGVQRVVRGEYRDFPRALPSTLPVVHYVVQSVRGIIQ